MPNTEEKISKIETQIAVIETRIEALSDVPNKLNELHTWLKAGAIAQKH